MCCLAIKLVGVSLQTQFEQFLLVASENYPFPSNYRFLRKSPKGTKWQASVCWFPLTPVPGIEKEPEKGTPKMQKRILLVSF